MMVRRILVVAIGVLTILALGGAALVSAQGTRKGDVSVAPDGCPMNFSDVPPGSTFYDYILCLYCHNIIGGYPDGTFRPNANVTRGQLSKIVAKSAGFNGNPGSQLFEDILP